MQNKIRLLQYLFAPLCIFLTCLMIVKTISYFFVQTQSAENIFHTSEWIPAKTSVILKHQNIQNEVQEYTNEEKITSYIDQNGEHFQLTITEGQNQFLSFRYKLESEEAAQKFDTSAVIAFANQTPLLQLAPTEYDGQWHEAFIDLHKSGLSSGVYDLLFITQNTYDDQFPPNFSVKEVMTTKFFPNKNSIFQFTTDKEVDSVLAKYRIWENEQEVVVQQELEVQTLNAIPTSLLSLPENFYGTELSFWSIDTFGNTEEPQYIYLHHSGNLNASQFETQIFTETDHELYVQLQFQNSDSTPKFIDARISQTQISSEQEWQQATQLEQKQFQQFFKANIPTIYTEGLVVSNLVFQNIPEGKQYLSLKMCNSSLICEYVLQNQVVESYL